MELQAKNTRPVHGLDGETAYQPNGWSRPGTRSLKLAEACASRTHRRHQRCRPPVLKTGTDTGLLTLPFRDQSMLMRAAEREDGPTEGAWVSAAQAPWQYTARTDEFDTARPHWIKKGLSTDIV